MNFRVLCVATGLLLAAGSVAQAHFPLAYRALYRSPYLLPSLEYAAEDVPYFALHPPVYYSHPVYVPYGYPGIQLAQAPVAEDKPAAPLLIQNPYLAPKSPARPTSNTTTTRGPERIINPFVDQPAGGPTDNLTRRGGAPSHN